MFNLDRRYLTLFVIQITEVLGFSLILPFLPYYAVSLGASPFVVSLILTTFSLFQFFTAPIMGRLSDSFGRKPLLILSQLSTFISFIILGFSNSLIMIFVSRIVDGLLGSNYSIAQAYLSDISSEENRSKAFGLSGVAFGIGFLFGPAIGGFLSQFGYDIPAFLAAAISLITIITTILFLEETVEEKQEFSLSFDIFRLSGFVKYFSDSQISCKLWQFLAYSLAHVVWVSNFAIFSKNKVGAEPNDIGWLLAYIGLISIIFRGFLMQKLIDRFSERKLIGAGSILLILGLVSAVFVNKLWMMPVVMGFFSTGTGLLRPLILGDISRNVASRYQGSVLGITSSLSSIAQIFGPIIGGFVLTNLPTYYLSLTAAVFMAAGLVLFFKECRTRKLTLKTDKRAL
jgi:DHA1 family tetracycline resistance protein-like MFS transporter